MKILKLKLFQESACYKKPFAFKVSETYPLPPYSTVIGMLHKVLQAKNGEYFDMNISIQGNYESIFSNYQTLRMYKSKTVTTMPRNVHQLLNVNLVIHVKADDEIIDKLFQNLTNGAETITLGRNEDLVRIDEIKIVQAEKVKRASGNYNIFVPNFYEEDINGIKYRLNSKYVIKNDIRKWDKVNVVYVEKDDAYFDESLKDDDGDLIFFYKEEN